MASARYRGDSSLHERLQELKKLIPELEEQADELRQSKHLQSALFEISELSHTAQDLGEFFGSLHRIIGGLMYAENLIVAVIEPDSGDIRFVYHADEAEPDVTADDMNEYPQDQLRKGLTYYVIKVGKLMHLDGEGIRRVEQEAGIKSMGELAHDWLAVPLLDGESPFGALLIQSYDSSIRYSREDEILLEFVCQHISSALQRKWASEALQKAHDKLEERVALRTRELSEAVSDLEREVTVRKRSEQIQHTLLKIARLASERMDMRDFYKHVHEAIAGLIDARNIYVALVDDGSGMLRFPYKVDETETDWPDEPLPPAEQDDVGPTVGVLRSGEAYLFRADETGFPAGAKGKPAVAWMGVPLKSDERVFGVLAVQSYSPNTRYSQKDKDLLSFVGQHVASAIQHRHDQLTIERARQELEHRVDERTEELQEANDALRGALDELKSTQGQLIEAEKLASLGQLVAGVAHEINTPLGVVITATTHLHEKIMDAGLGDQYGATFDLILKSLERATKLVSSFKLVGGDPSSGSRRRFNLHDYLDASMVSLAPIIDNAGHSMTIHCSDGIEIDGYPSVIDQILTNLVTNSIVHGFGDGRIGAIRLEAEQQDDDVVMVYRDNGVGVTDDVRQRMFEPFYTTSRSSGSTGLGLHIVFNRVNRVGGQIDITSAPGKGVQFDIRMPLVFPAGKVSGETALEAAGTY
ncbi:MAG: GAF domain-containing protein [Xanthomonadales bacterium]|nr:GAF domain-containing protein [Xanthomonadales bacterium]